MATVKEIHTNDFVKEGVRYTIHVEESEDGMKWGTWNCQECNVGGSTRKVSQSSADAVEAAKSDLERHHTMNHQV